MMNERESCGRKGNEEVEGKSKTGKMLRKERAAVNLLQGIFIMYSHGGPVLLNRPKGHRPSERSDFTGAECTPGDAKTQRDLKGCKLITKGNKTR